MKFDREGVTFKDGTGFYWTFPRLLFRLRNGYWCDHKTWEPSSEGRPDGWVRVDYRGGKMMRRCATCTWTEWK